MAEEAKKKQGSSSGKGRGKIRTNIFALESKADKVGKPGDEDDPRDGYDEEAVRNLDKQSRKALTRVTKSAFLSFFRAHKRAKKRRRMVAKKGESASDALAKRRRQAGEKARREKEMQRWAREMDLAKRRFSVPDDKYYTLSEEQRVAVNLIEQGDNVFVTGGAGTGKSMLQDVVYDAATRRKLTVVRLAATGVAAENIGGVTLHSAIDIQLGKLPLRAYINRPSPKRQTIFGEADMVIIDEVGGLEFEYLVKAERLVAATRGERGLGKPWGGIQMVALGDFCQLTSGGEREGEGTLLAKNREWCAWFPTTVVLRQVFRQEGDDEFIQLLDALRVGSITEDELLMLNACVGNRRRSGGGKASHVDKDSDEFLVADESPERSMEPMLITPFRKTASEENAFAHARLPPPGVEFTPELHILLSERKEGCGVTTTTVLEPGTALYKCFVKDAKQVAKRLISAPRSSNRIGKEADRVDTHARLRDPTKRWTMGGGENGVRGHPHRGREAYKQWKEDRAQRAMESTRATIDLEDQVTSGMVRTMLSSQNVEPRIEFKVGDQVMLTRNVNPSAGLVNGTCGMVVGFTLNRKGRKLSEEEVEAALELRSMVRRREPVPTADITSLIEGSNVALSMESNFDTPYESENGLATGAHVVQYQPLTRDIGEVRNALPVVRFSTGCFVIRPHASRYELFGVPKANKKYLLDVQVPPMCYSWASTVHKTQGCTLREVTIDPRGIQQPGQLYVALSRVQSLDGLHLLHPIKQEYIVTSEQAARYDRVLMRLGSKLNAPAIPSDMVHHNMWIEEGQDQMETHV